MTRPWRLANSLETLRAQLNKAYPNRRKSSDGTIGDAKHASRSSDHNPHVIDGKYGVVTAIDFTHDPERGVDSEKLANLLLASRDPRIKYIISNRKIVSSEKTKGIAAWNWRPYTGSNPHDKHMHLSVKSDKTSYDSTVLWDLKAQEVKFSVVSASTSPLASEEEVTGDPEVYHVQRRLKGMNYNPGGLDGIWGGLTAGAISAFLNDRNSKIKPPTSLTTFREVLKSLRDEMAAAEKVRFTRPIAPERAMATVAELAPKLPEVQAATTAERAGFWTSITTAIGAVLTGVINFMSEAIEWLGKLKEFAGDIPWYWWTAGALAVSLTMYMISRKTGEAKNAAVTAYQEGARV